MVTRSRLGSWIGSWSLNNARGRSDLRFPAIAGRDLLRARSPTVRRDSISAIVGRGFPRVRRQPLQLDPVEDLLLRRGSSTSLHLRWTRLRGLQKSLQQIRERILSFEVLLLFFFFMEINVGGCV